MHGSYSRFLWIAWMRNDLQQTLFKAQPISDHDLARSCTHNQLVPPYQHLNNIKQCANDCWLPWYADCSNVDLEFYPKGPPERKRWRRVLCTTYFECRCTLDFPKMPQDIRKCLKMTAQPRADHKTQLHKLWVKPFWHYFKVWASASETSYNNRIFTNVPFDNFEDLRIIQTKML